MLTFWSVLTSFVAILWNMKPLYNECGWVREVLGVSVMGGGVVFSGVGHSLIACCLCLHPRFCICFVSWLVFPLAVFPPHYSRFSIADWRLFLWLFTISTLFVCYYLPLLLPHCLTVYRLARQIASKKQQRPT